MACKRDIEQRKVSVIIPTFNRGGFLERAVHSIINQDYKNIEIIIVDDRSTDNTESIVDAMKDRFPFIVYCKNDHHKGPSGARNTGITKSSGEYLAFLDSDDIWLDNHLKNGMEILLNNPEIDLLFANHKVVDSLTGKHLYNFFDQHQILPSLKSVSLSPNTKLLKDNLFNALIQENFFHFGSSIMRKSSIRGIFLDESIMFAEDRDFVIRLQKEANATFAYREDPVFILYRHDSNLIRHQDLNTNKKIIEAHLYLFTKYLRTYPLSKTEKRTLQKIISKRLLNLSYNCRMSKKPINGLLSTLESFKYNLSLNQFKELAKLLIDCFSVTRKR